MLKSDAKLIGFYDPYLETLGSGEKVFLTILEEAVKQKGAKIILFFRAQAGSDCLETAEHLHRHLPVPLGKGERANDYRTN